MARPVGSRNKRTIAREQRERDKIMAAARGARGAPTDPVLQMDSLAIMQTGMRYFYRKYAESLRIEVPDDAISRALLLDAVAIAEKVAPYEHHRLATLKLSHDPADSAINSEATAAELKAEIMAEIAALGLVQVPTGVANRVSKGSTSSH